MHGLSFYTYTTGMDFPWDYSIIPDIPQLSPELTQTFPVYTQTSPDGNPWMPGLFTDIHWGPELTPDIPWRSPDGPIYPLTSPEVGRCLSGYRNIIFVLSLGKRENVLRNVT